MNLTNLEKKALEALQLSANNCSGGGFAIVEETEWSGSRKQLGALITTLQQKGVVESVDVCTTSEGRYTQVTLARSQ